MWKPNRSLAGRRCGQLAGIAILSAIVALALSPKPALAYQLEGPIWAGQPSPGICCANLNVFLGFNYQSYDTLGWNDGITAWNASEAYIVYNKTQSAPITLTDTYNSSVTWDGITIYYSSGGYFTSTTAYLNYYYTASEGTPGIQAVATHELGHVAGLGHEFTGCIIMDPGPYLDTWLTCGLNTPQQDDVNGINALY